MDQIQNKARMTHKGALRSMQMMINAPRKKWEPFDQEQVGRQLIASVLLFINEVELLIYRFLSSGVKNSKRYPRLVELWVDRITSRWALNALTGYRCLDRTSTGKGVNLNQEEKATGWERFSKDELHGACGKTGDPAMVVVRAPEAAERWAGE